MSRCGRCGADFGCAQRDGALADRAGLARPCWCTLLPAVLALPGTADAACWCPACLQQQIDAHQGATAPGPAPEPAALVHVK